MKTKTALLIRLILILPFSLLFANCGGSSGGSSAVSGYYINANQCYITGTTTVTAATNCQTGTYYQYVNGVCYNSTETANVGLQYCMGGAAATGFYIYNNQCYVTGTTTVTATTNCQTGTYYIYNSSTGQCLNTAGTNVGTQYCMGTATTLGTTAFGGTTLGTTLGGVASLGGATAGTVLCNGPFYVASYGSYPQEIYCNAYNYYCTGAIVYTTSGQAVRCQ